jgi:hypothetical protein
VWQVSVEGEIYEADFDTIKEWIAEGRVKSTDQVRKGNLRWLEAGRAPGLSSLFAIMNENNQSLLIADGNK